MRRGAAVAVALALVGASLAAWAQSPPGMPMDHGGMHMPMEHGGRHGPMGEHVHPPVPAAYRDARLPAGGWTDRAMLERGARIYADRCQVCHGANGDGRGPGAAGLRPAPASFRDHAMVEHMSDAYWFWRVSEGGTAEPFRSEGSAMPAWKGVLSPEDRWAVIVYAHHFARR